MSDLRLKKKTPHFWVVQAHDIQKSDQKWLSL